VPLLAVVSGNHDPYVPYWVRESLVEFSGPYSWSEKAQSVPFDAPGKHGSRTYTSWTESGLNLGAMQVKEKTVGAPALNTAAFNPVAVQWNTSHDEIGWFC
jgi:hypothetical protein